jgi:pimeloyl-ACP methyl ester carboxylesterase
VEDRITLDDGAPTTIERWGKKGPAILCVHGMTSSRKSWERFAQHYAGAARVFAYDQRGHGDSSEVAGPMTLHRALLDLYNVMQAMREPVDTLVGHSWGGAVAILGGRRFDAKRVVAVDPMIRQAGDPWYDEFLADLKTMFARKGAERDAYIQEEYSKLGWAHIDVERKKHAVRTMTVEPIERLRSENPPEAWDLRADLENYPKPLLLAMADSTRSIVTLDDLKHIRDRGGANVAIRVFEGGDHNVHRTQFERFTQEFDAFIART